MRTIKVTDTLTLTIDDNGKAIDPPESAFTEVLGALRDSAIRQNDLALAETAMFLAGTEEVRIRGPQVIPGTGLDGIVDVPKRKNIVGATLLWNGRVFRRNDAARSVYDEVLPVVVSSTTGARRPADE